MLWGIVSKKTFVRVGGLVPRMEVKYRYRKGDVIYCRLQIGFNRFSNEFLSFCFLFLAFSISFGFWLFVICVCDLLDFELFGSKSFRYDAFQATNSV